MDPLAVYLGGGVAAALLGGFQWLLKQMIARMQDDHKNLVEDHKELQQKFDKAQETYFRKEDFKEFKQELWQRLDSIEKDFKAEIVRLKS